ncbi:MAG TPA: hypothetical protein VK281_17430 [Xanthobacteraceae bacterium]|nr:hypothetical protein [Xanthobacteraceae bacterium]
MTQPLPVSGHAANVTAENYDVQDFGNLRVIVTATQLRGSPGQRRPRGEDAG